MIFSAEMMGGGKLGSGAVEVIPNGGVSPALAPRGVTPSKEMEKVHVLNAKGERGKAAKPSGIGNPFKKLKPHPADPTKVIYKDPHTGKTYVKPKPQGFDEWWNSK